MEAKGEAAQHRPGVEACICGGDIIRSDGPNGWQHIAIPGLVVPHHPMPRPPGVWLIVDHARPWIGNHQCPAKNPSGVQCLRELGHAGTHNDIG